MKSKISVIGVIVFGLVGVAGCESVALMPRPDIDETGVSRSRADRQSDVGRFERESDRARGEVTGTVQRIDEARREIHLRTGERNVVVFRYDPKTLVYDRDRDFPVQDLRSGDEVVVRPSGGSGYEQYADVIRIIDRRSGASSRR